MVHRPLLKNWLYAFEDEDDDEDVDDVDDDGENNDDEEEDDFNHFQPFHLLSETFCWSCSLEHCFASLIFFSELLQSLILSHPDVETEQEQVINRASYTYVQSSLFHVLSACQMEVNKIWKLKEMSVFEMVAGDNKRWGSRAGRYYD